MSYFDDLSKAIRDLQLWADLRHEQGVAVQGKVSALSRQIARLRRQLQRARPGATMLRAEPNDLASIRKLRRP